MNTRSCARVLGPFLLLAGLTMQASEIQHSREFTIKIENDIVGGSDSQYTSGVEISWLQQARNANTARRIHRGVSPTFRLLGSLDSVTHSHYDTSFSIGQKLFTPDFVNEIEIVENDRPYASWSYLNFGLHQKNRTSSQSLAFTLGMIGPKSFGEDLQRGIHQLIGDAVPLGWHHQLKNEVGANIGLRSMNRTYQLEFGNERSLELFASKELSIGNIDTSALIGGNLRFGRNLKFGAHSSRILSAGQGGVFDPSYFHEPAFTFKTQKARFNWIAGANIAYVARNIFLDGNSSRPSHRVAKKTLVGEMEIGFRQQYKNLVFSFLYVYRTEEFHDQIGGHSFGSFSFSTRR